MRVGVAAVFLSGVLALRGQWRMLRRDVGAWVLVGLSNSALPFCLFAYATLSISAGEAAILNATAPLWAVAVARVWLGTPVAPMRWLGAVCGLLGVGVLFAGRAAGSGDHPGGAVLAGLVAALSYGVAAAYSKRRLTDTPPLVVATGSLIAATLSLLPLCAWAWPAHAIAARVWIAALVMGVACTGVAYILYFRLIRRLGASRAISVTFLVPLFAVLWGRAVLHEAVGVQTLLGGVAVLVGTALSTLPAPMLRLLWQRRPTPAA